MAFNVEAYNTVQEALELLKTKSDYAYPRMVGYLQVNVGLEDAKRILKLVQEFEGDK